MLKYLLKPFVINTTGLLARIGISLAVVYMMKQKIKFQRQNIKKPLIVNDQQEIREMLEFVFKFVGFNKLFTAKNGEKAIDIAIKEKPDLILMDV